ncbi:lysylphosphatidylglycerol synthase transmembrane domain-containing protein [Williamwhitmania taraxaci]|uniref:Lysylphosphatidylglycerol synthase TM region n=1 Tax=Williamwhitmania taraxaci TaxID=1640674 RepID=A0A1G6MYA8_9BACT|nr:lysylphosphatidylglycerol synthase transmembrane domain-containing protein [Williamwhitmania taraxaci]SDC60523.1 hypothetical protein SAMN05216323_103924 [Williamwhitmania taraxaci]
MKHISTTLKYLLFLSIGVALLYFAFKDMPLAKLWDGLKTANYYWVGVTVMLGVAAYISRAYRWNLLIESLGYKPRLLHTTSAVLVGYLANIAFPRLGEVTRCAMLHKSDKIPFDSLVGTVIVERAFDIFTLIILILVVAISKISLFGNFFSQHLIVPLSKSIGNNINIPTEYYIFSGLILLGLVVFGFLLREKFKHSTPVLKIKKAAVGVIVGLKTGYQMKRRKAFLFSTLVLWVSYWLMSWLIVFAIPETGSLGPLDGLFLLAAGSIGMAAPVQGGFGSFHLMLALALGLYGISWENGLIVATLSHESQALFAVILGIIGFYIIVFSVRKQKTTKE